LFKVLQIISIVLVSIAMTPAMAHALELPGKYRLSKSAYFTVQPIYYPGFTLAGTAEPVGMLALLLLVILTPGGTTTFWLTLGALLALLAMHCLYWLLTHPVNNFWLADFELKGLGARFFAFEPIARAKTKARSATPDWKRLRDRWEYSHVARAGLAFLAFILLASAIVL
jgi:hypothetical protein